MVDAGAIMHGSLTTASMLSTATIREHAVTCGVGSLALDTEIVSQLAPLLGGMIDELPILGGSTGAFAMLMYTTSMESFKANRDTGMLRAAGRMRSITRIADNVVEDVEHDFLAIAMDGKDHADDSFAVHFLTPFWTFPNNPLATPSDHVDGWSKFGGTALVGEIVCRNT